MAGADLYLPYQLLPQSEQDVGRLIYQNLVTLPRLLDDFNAALILFNRSHEEQSELLSRTDRSETR